jgi:hypothetical protein
MIALGLDRQGSFEKERRSYSYARLSKTSVSVKGNIR